MTRTLLTSMVRRTLSGRSMPSTVQRTRLFLMTRLWAWPLIAAVGLGMLGFWVTRTVEGEMKHQMRGDLKAILDADVTALRLWFETVADQAESLALGPNVRQVTRALIAQADAGPEGVNFGKAGSSPRDEIRALLTPRVKALDYVNFFLVDAKMRVVGEMEDGTVGRTLKGYQKEFAEKVFREGPSVSRPHPSTLLLKDFDSEERPGVPTMFAGAPLLGEDGKPFAGLFLRIPPEGTFTEILQVARAGDSGETYAFDKTGRFLSQSRFDDDLKRMGLLADRPGERSILTLELRDPGVNMTEGKRPAKLRAEQPLTRMAASATKGESGVDVEGYLDYRGVPSLAAWTWLPEYGMGVVTEVDAEEVYRPLTIIRWTFRGLFALLAAFAVAIFVFMVMVARKRQEVLAMAMTAKTLGQYHLEEKIGSGGMGSVYKAKHALLRRPTAIKMLDVDKISDSAVARFEREVQFTSALNHPNTIAIYDFGHTPEGLFYYAMEFLDGMNLEDLVNRHGPLPDGRVAAILQQVCGSLAEAHDAGLVHRDIKPANVILNRRGGQYDVVKVLDFGLVKSVGSDHEAGLTSSNSLTGTPLYLSPEAIETPDAVDYRTDLYAVGAMGYFLVTGTPVFNGKSIVEICMHHVRTPPEPPSKRLGDPIASRLETVILRCLQKNREDRPQSAQAIIDELAHSLATRPWTRIDAETWWRTVGLAPVPSSDSASPTTVASGSFHAKSPAADFGETVAVNRSDSA